MIKVINEHETIKRLIYGCSIARFGDGEFKLCIGKNQISQPHNKKIQKKLMKILHSDIDYLLIGIPRIYAEEDFNQMPLKKQKYWNKYRKNQAWSSLPLKNKLYYSAFISRPDSMPCINNDDYWNQVKQIWEEKDILMVEGKGYFGKNEQIIDNAKSIDRFKAPAYDAFKDYDGLLKAIIRRAKGNKVILLSLGPTATCLAYDLHLKGFQVIDVGHMSMFFARTHPKAEGYKGTEEETKRWKMEQRGQC